MHTASISVERRTAISRAASALVRLSIDPEVAKPARRLNGIVNDASTHTDCEAWDAVGDLEDMVFSRGLQAQQEVKPTLRPGRLYLAWDRIVCEAGTCAGGAARSTGKTLHGRRLELIPMDDADSWAAGTGKPLTCECGAVTYPGRA